MGGGPQCTFLPDGRRLHLNHGPIDLIIETFGSIPETELAYRQAVNRFADILPTLAAELDLLRQPVCSLRHKPNGPVAARMMAACWPHRGEFVTPMAAVAGAVADDMLAALIDGRDLERAYVNNGGDIAFYLSPGATLTAGLVGDYHLPVIDATCALANDQPARGIATSGWKGRSLSFGIADSVTVLARTAAAADVAATLVANAVNIDDQAVERVPAIAIDPDSDLGDRLVTTSVGTLNEGSVALALDLGAGVAAEMERAGLITAAVLVLHQQFRTIGSLPVGLIAEHAA